MSGCNDEVDQCEKRKSIDAAMGDVLGKESASATEHEDDINSNDQTEKDGREEADGAPAESVVAKDNNDDPSNVRVNVMIGETTNNIENQQKADAAAESISLEKDNVPVPSDSSLVASGSPTRRAQGPCCCDACKDRRDLLTEQLEEVTRLQGLWMELRQHIRSVFRAAMDANCIPRSPRPKHDKAHLENMHEITLQLCKRDPHQLFMRLEGQAQEFVVETKVRLLDLLQNRNANNLAEIFLTGLLDGYDALLSAASHLASLIEPLETEHLCKFNVTWECLNKRLYQSCVYTDPLVQNNLPPFIGQLRKLLPLKGVEYQGLVHRYLAFDDEMTRISDMWPEAERLIDKYNQEQATLKAKQKMLREDYELFKARRKLIQQRMRNRTFEDLTEFDEQLLTLATLGAVGALSPNSRPPSPNSELSLEALNLPLDRDILESLAQDTGKSAHLRLADMVGALASVDDQADMNGHGIVPPTSLNGHCAPEYWFGYECAVNHILNYGFVTPPPSPRSESPSNNERGNGEGSEGDVIRNEEQKCECHVCTEPRTSPTHIGKGSPLSLNLHTNSFNPFPPISNGLSGGTNCTATNGSVDMNGVYPHLYNLHAALGSLSNKVPTDSAKSTVGKSDEKKLRYFSPQVRKKSVDIDLRTKQRNESVSEVEDTDLREMEPQPCPCVYQHAREIVERKKGVLENPPCSCLLKSKQKWDTCPCLKKACRDPATTNGHAPPESPTSSATKTLPATKKVSSRSSTTQPAPIQTRHSTTQTPNINHNHNNLPHPGPTHAHSHAPLPDLVKGQSNAHRGHTHANHAPHACHKQADVEHIKRVSCTDLGTGDGDCSDSGSSQEDSCSTTSSTPRDSSRHCDCCYCEVFGHGVPSVAPVSRNYNEMRERLRLLLTKKKAKKCKAVGSPPKTVVETTSANVGTASNTQTNVSGLRPNTPVSVGPVQTVEAPGDQRDLEALLEFIEGNQSVNKKDNKKAEKKAKQKQKKLEEKLKKDREEAEQQRLVELQKKTPEVTITVVDPQKPALQRLLPQHTLPEVSILPALGTSVPIGSALRQSSKKKEKDDTVVNANQAKPAPAAQKTKNGVTTKRIESDNSKSKNVNSTDQLDGVRTSTLIPEERNAKLEKKCKKERQKLKREAAKAQEEALAKEAAMAKNAAEIQPQIVTIKRVMESSSTEPTVTITLKGQTPEEDKVLFTLVNGQTKEPKAENQGQKAAGKKKKNKGNQQQQSTKTGTVQQSSGNSSAKQQRNTTESKNAKNQLTTEKAKIAKPIEEKSTNSKTQSNNCGEAKTSKSKKEKKNVENKENLIQSANNANKGKNQQVSQSDNESKKKQGKVVDSQSVQNKQQNSNGDTNNKKAKGQSHEKNNQTSKNKSNVNVAKAKSNNQNNQNPASKGPTTAESQGNTAAEAIGSPLSSQFKDIGANSEINIDNLILPPGITITKVNTPVKPVPVRSALPPKPVSPPKQTTIIAAPMGRVQSNYASSQAGGNVIVVDTGKLKQDLLPQTSDKDCPKDNQQKQSTNGKKKKKKSKTGSAASNPGQNSGNSNAGAPLTNGHLDEQARIVHNPGSNMVTIRNPAFGPPKMEPTQQAAIIKVSENGMVTIRSPALQQAINAGLTPPPKPDFIVKGDPSSVNKTMPSHNSPAKQNSIIPASLAELRSRLTPDCTGLARLANIHISKVTSGQDIPENGINLKGTSVTLTKVRSEAVMENVQQAKTAVREAISATMAATSSGKGKKKKKKGNGSRQNGDDWNLVESVFTPKDIDLEDGEMDDAERELEAFKRFCLQSVPPARKEKVNLNIKDIVLKKKSQTATAIAAN